jgi:hypothetical protein
MYQNAIQNDFIAISMSEFTQFGCPYCGYRSGYMPMSGGGTAISVCGECRFSCCVLTDGLNKSTIGLGGDLYPSLQPHPRYGTPSHGREDTKPQEGEHFWSRGIGSDYTPGCFVCGGPTGLYNNISAFVQCREAGQRIVTMFPTGVRMDYRDYEPDRIQVKIGACENHLDNLKILHDGCVDNIINEEKIFRAQCDLTVDNSVSI